MTLTSTPSFPAWHSDFSSSVRPGYATMLHARELPPSGGETGFIDTYGRGRCSHSDATLYFLMKNH
jgi:hypothetical protein